jgi:hypothetical protein
MATRKTKKVAGPSVVKGTHLTVITDENGKTTLEWDDEQLLKEVREAIASVEKKVKPAVKAKSNKKVPETMKRKEVAKKAPAKKTTAKKTTK